MKTSFLVGFLLLTACAPPLDSSAPLAGNSVATVTSGIGHRSQLVGRTMTPLEIIEDSRCPANVRCIQAGTVRIKLRLQERRVSSEAIIGLDQPVRLQTAWLHLVGVYPARVVPDVLSQSDYRFTFAITERADPPAVQVPCT